MLNRRGLMAGGAALALVGCGVAPEGGWATDDAVARAAYRHDGPPALTLFTMVSNRSGQGAHTSLMINASQRVIFDPAGSVRHSTLTEQRDVLYGITPQVADFYARAHARETYHVVIQRLVVSPDMAQRAFDLVRANGAVAQAQCALVTSGILRQLPGLDSISVTWFPNVLAEQFGALPGVRTRTLYENDADDKSVAIAEYAATVRDALGQ